MDATIPHTPVPAPRNPGAVRDQVQSQQQQIADLRAELDELKAQLHYLFRLLSIDPDDFEFPHGG